MTQPTQEEIEQGRFTRIDAVDIPEGARNISYFSGTLYYNIGLARKMTHCPHQVGESFPVREDYLALRYRGQAIVYHKSNSDDYELASKIIRLNDYVNWKPAEIMPEEFARYTATVTKVECRQMSDLSPVCIALALGFTEGPIVEQCDKAIEQWNKENPNHPYSPDQWVFITEFEINKKESQ